MRCLVGHLQLLLKDITSLPLNLFIKQFKFPTVSTFQYYKQLLHWPFYYL